MKKQLFLAYVLAGAWAWGCTNKQPTATVCIDPAKIDNERACIMLYDPVCGCDGNTYDNSCSADIKGVTSYTKGECPPKTTTNN